MITENVTKRCSTCKEDLTVGHFNANKSKKDGLSNLCKDCQKEISRKHYQSNKQQYFDRNKKVKRANRLKILELKQNSPCTDCGQVFHPYIMEFDHTEPETKNFEIGRAGQRTLKQITQELEQCEIVCANCHKLRTFRRMQAAKTDFYLDV